MLHLKIPTLIPKEKQQWATAKVVYTKERTNRARENRTADTETAGDAFSFQFE